jgi:hypothetical protein
MRLRLAFKLHGQEAELARYLADAAGVEVDKVAKLAMQRYMREVFSRAEEMQKQVKDGTLILPSSEGDLDVRLQSSEADSVHLDGAVPSSQDTVPS